MSATGELLATHPLIRTSDVDEARSEVARVFCPHRLTPADTAPGFALRHNRAPAGAISLHYMDYGSAVRITPGDLSSFFLVQIPLSGRAEVRCGDRRVLSTPAVAAVPSPADPLDMEWDDGTAHLVVHLPRAHVEQGWQVLTGTDLRGPLRFELGMDLTSVRARSWVALVRLLLDDADRQALHDAVRDHVVEAVVSGLLTMQRHSHSDVLAGGPGRVPAPRAVRQAMDACETSPEADLTVADLARTAGVSVRSLQEAFRRHIGMSPVEYLRDVRLRRVHDDLLRAAPDELSVAEVAYAWGFTHLGRFAKAYRHRYGELPSDTLRR